MKPKFQFMWIISILLTSLLLLSGCGGAAGTAKKGDTDAKPMINISSSMRQSYDQVLILWADASDNGSIKSYVWKDAKGNKIGDKALLTIDAPHPLGETTYSVSVTDNVGQTSTKSIKVTIESDLPVISLPDTQQQDNDKDLIISADISDDGEIVGYEWKDAQGNIVSDKKTLRVSAPLEMGTLTYTLTVTDDVGQKSSKSISVLVNDGKYDTEDHGIAIYMKNKPSSEYQLSQVTDSKFNALDDLKKYQVADKLLSTLFFAYPLDQLKQKIDSGHFISDLQKQFLVSENNMAIVEANINDENRYYLSDNRPDLKILARFYEMSKLDKIYLDHWTSYILAQTILFSPAAELQTVANPDAFGVYNRLFNLQQRETGMRYAAFVHMQSDENWRRFRSPEDNGREMLEIYALDEVDEHVPVAAQALQNWRLNKDKDTLVIGLNKNTEPLTLLGEMNFTTGVDFYAALAKSNAFTKGVTTRLVNYMFAASSDEKKAQLINQIVSSNPETWQDVLLQILFSEDYLLHTSRVKSIEEANFPLMKKVSYNTSFYSFSTLSNEMKKMGQLAMSYKLGRLNRVPLDNVSFGTYQKYLREQIFRAWSRDTPLSVNPRNRDETHNSTYYMSNFKSYQRRGISSRYFMSEDKYQVVNDNPQKTVENYITYLFKAILYRAPRADELAMFSEHINGVPPADPQWFYKALVYENEDKDYQTYVRYSGRYYIQYIVFEYMLRLDDMYFFKEVE